MKVKARKTKKSRAVGYGTFGKSVLASNPRKVIVSMVVIPKKRTHTLFTYFLNVSFENVRT